MKERGTYGDVECVDGVMQILCFSWFHGQVNFSLLSFFPLNEFSFYPWILELSSGINLYVENVVLANWREHEWQKSIKLIFISFSLCFPPFHYISASNTAHFHFSCFCSPWPYTSNFVVLSSSLYQCFIYFSSPSFSSLSRTLRNDNNFVTKQASAEVTLWICLRKVIFSKTSLDVTYPGWCLKFIQSL
jgi:hypothetical protein